MAAKRYLGDERGRGMGVRGGGGEASDDVLRRRHAHALHGDSLRKRAGKRLFERSVVVPAAAPQSRVHRN
jgi:hypothetical protein